MVETEVEGAEVVVATEVEAGVTAEGTAVGPGFLGLGKTG